MASHCYRMVLTAEADRDLRRLSEDLGVDKAEVLRRALLLLRHAVKAEKVILITKATKAGQQIVKVR